MKLEEKNRKKENENENENVGERKRKMGWWVQKETLQIETESK